MDRLTTRIDSDRADPLHDLGEVLCWPLTTLCGPGKTYSVENYQVRERPVTEWEKVAAVITLIATLPFSLIFAGVGLVFKHFSSSHRSEYGRVLGYETAKRLPRMVQHDTVMALAGAIGVGAVSTYEAAATAFSAAANALHSLKA